MLGLECSTVCSRDVDGDSVRRKLEAFEIWIEEWKRSADEDVLRRANEYRQMLNSV